MDEWNLWKLNDSVFTLEHRNDASPQRNLFFDCIPKKKETVLRLAIRGANQIDSTGVAEFVHLGRIVPFKGAGYSLFEFKISRSTVWRMFLYKDPGNRFVVIIDIFESHKSEKNRLAMARADADKWKFVIAQSLALKLD